MVRVPVGAGEVVGAGVAGEAAGAGAGAGEVVRCCKFPFLLLVIGT